MDTARYSVHRIVGLTEHCPIWGNNAAQCHRSIRGLVFLVQFSDLRSRNRARLGDFGQKNS